MFILIAQKLTEQFLNAVEAGSKRDLYYWHAYYVSYIPSSLVICYLLALKRRLCLLFYRIKDCQLGRLLY